MGHVLDPAIATEAAEIAATAESELAALVDVSSPSGDVPGAEAAIAVCIDLLPGGAEIERPPCSTKGSAPDLIATVRGSGVRRIMLLGHVDTVIGHDAHQPLRPEGERLYGTGTVDMKGGDVLALGVARARACWRASRTSWTRSGCTRGWAVRGREWTRSRRPLRSWRARPAASASRS